MCGQTAMRDRWVARGIVSALRLRLCRPRWREQPSGAMRAWSVLTVLFLPMAEAGAADGRPGGQEAAAEVRAGLVRLVYPASADVDGTEAECLIRAAAAVVASDRGSARGWARERAFAGLVTLSLAREMDRAVDARSIPSEGLIILPLSRVFDWGEDKFRWIIRHEMAHLNMAALLGASASRWPTWFREGFAEWAAGGLSCEGQVRVLLDLAARRRSDVGLPAILTAGGNGLARVAYEYYATVFEYLDKRTGGGVQSGDLLRVVATHGLRDALRILVGRDSAEIEEEWQGYVTVTYSGSLDELSCTGGTWRPVCPKK